MEGIGGREDGRAWPIRCRIMRGGAGGRDGDGGTQGDGSRAGGSGEGRRAVIGRWGGAASAGERVARGSGCGVSSNLGFGAPAGLAAAGQVEFEDAERIGNNEMALYFTAPKFGEVAQAYYSQPTLFDDGPSESDTAFDVFSDAVGDVLAGKADSDRYDVGLLKRFQRFESSVFETQIDELLIWGDRIPETSPRQVSREFPNRAEGFVPEDAAVIPRASCGGRL